MGSVGVRQRANKRLRLVFRLPFSKACLLLGREVGELKRGGSAKSFK